MHTIGQGYPDQTPISLIWLESIYETQFGNTTTIKAVCQVLNLQPVGGANCTCIASQTLFVLAPLIIHPPGAVGFIERERIATENPPTPTEDRNNLGKKPAPPLSPFTHFSGERSPIPGGAGK